MQKTIGGDRLGSGKKMKVHLHGFSRSTHDLGYLWRSSMAAGTLVPFMSKIGLPGDTFDINLNCVLKTHPSKGPLFGSYKVQLDTFVAPIRLYNSLLHNNALGIGNKISNVKIPQIQLTVDPTPTNAQDIDNSQINPSCILSYLGMRGGGITSTTTTREFNALSYLAYWEIYKNYYANKQEEIGAVIHTPTETLITTVDSVEVRDLNNVDFTISLQPADNPENVFQGYLFIINYTGAQPDPSQIMVQTEEWGLLSLNELAVGWVDQVGYLQGQLDWFHWGNIRVRNWRYKDTGDIGQGIPKVSTFPLANIDTMRQNILGFQSIVSPFLVNNGSPEPYNWPLQQSANGINNALSNQEGLALKTYQSDLFNNWLQTEWIDGTGGINEITSIDTTSGSFNIDTLNLAKKVYDMLNRIAISGGSYDDWLDAVYTEERHRRCESPMYMGGLIKELVFQEVISNSQSTDQPLGTLAGKGVMSGKHKGGHVTIKIDEPSYIIGIVSLTPRIDYSQGNEWDVNLKTLDDLHKPGLDEIGFQELITEQMAWWSTEYDTITSTWVQKSAGKQPAWLNYMTSVNQVRGNFAIADNEMFMTLNRRYEKNALDGAIADLTTYIDPAKFNFIFAETAIDAQNFWCQIAVDITARRKMSAKLMPNM